MIFKGSKCKNRVLNVPVWLVTGRGFEERKVRLGFIENCLLTFTFYKAHEPNLLLHGSLPPPLSPAS